MKPRSSRHAHTGRDGTNFRVEASRGLDVNGRLITRPMPAVHAHDDIEMYFISSGGVRFLFNGRYFSLPYQKVGLYWSGIPHQACQLEPGTFSWYVNLPLAWFLQWQLPAPLVKPVLSGQMMIDDATEPVAIEEATFRRWKKLTAAGTEETRQIALMEIQARIRRMALAVRSAATITPDAPEQSTSATFLKFERMMRRLVEQACDPELSICDAAAGAGLQLNYACMLFRRHAGRRPVEFLTQQRLAHAQHLLAASDRKILDVAAASGFGSPARFYAAFAQYCHESPRQYRQRMRNSVA